MGLDEKQTCLAPAQRTVNNTCRLSGNPRSRGTPRPNEGRRRQAGLLARGSLSV